MNIHGYLLFQSLEFRVNKRLLINIRNGKSVVLPEKTSRCLEYILLYSNEHQLISKKFIDELWVRHEKQGPKLSLSRLINQIHDALLSIGFDRALIKKSAKKEYCVDSRDVSLIYSK